MFEFNGEAVSRTYAGVVGSDIYDPVIVIEIHDSESVKNYAARNTGCKYWSIWQTLTKFKPTLLHAPDFLNLLHDAR